MITVIDLASKTRTPVSEGHVRTLLSSDEGTRVHVAIRDVDPGKTCRVGASDRTQVVYILEGKDATIIHRRSGTTTRHVVGRRAGVYLEPAEEASVSAGATPLVLLLVTVPKHNARPATGGAPAVGYFFEESHLRSLIDEKGFRERTFWVNKETGLSGSWDLQLGRMLYASRAHSPRHVHHPSKTSTVVPEHFYFIETGTGEVKHDHGSLPVGPGSLVLIPSGEWHQLIASDSGFDYIEFQAPFDFATTMDHDPLGKNWYIKGTDDGTGKPQRWVQS
jgi:mannose-6-phosphate isomerase-like protein (cupin superfamily)